MRFAVLADIHSNVVALEACMAYIGKHPVDGIFLLGDYVSDCPHPQRTLERIKELQKRYPCMAVRGNREEAFLDYREGKEKSWGYTSYQGSLLYTYERLREEDFAWFQSLSHTTVAEIPGAEPVRLAHGSPDRVRELLDEGKENTKACLERLDTRYLLAGHTHRQMLFTYKGKMILNPGSVGVAIGVQSAAHMAYMEWKDGRYEMELLTIPYDFEKVRAEFRNSTLLESAHLWPRCILKSIAVGVNVGPLCAKKAYDLAVADHAVNREGRVPESYFQKAAVEYGIY